jgi:heme a synthase
MPAARWIRILCLTGLLLCFTVVVLGAYVRLTAAGLGCPDWPGCYGHVTPLGAQANAAAQAAFPTRPLDVGKAWREMIHRYAASSLGLIIIAIAVLGFTTRRSRLVSPGLALALLATVIFQGALGALTVTWQVTPPIVTAHLLFGLTTLGLLWWIWLSLQPAIAPNTATLPPRSPARTLVVVGLIALVCQIGLGGWTSTNYAAIACPDFPTCQGSWWPQTDYRAAFVLWRGLGVNYEGGVLTNTARVAIHLTHRMGAVIATLALVTAALTVMTRSSSRVAVLAGAAVLAALALQLAIGVSMVLRGFPLLLATAHTAGAALLLLSTLALLRACRNSPVY